MYADAANTSFMRNHEGYRHSQYVEYSLQVAKVSAASGRISNLAPTGLALLQVSGSGWFLKILAPSLESADVVTY